jgi:hypothetical protein
LPPRCYHFWYIHFTESERGERKDERDNVKRAEIVKRGVGESGRAIE